MKIDALVDVEVPQLKEKKKRKSKATQREKSFYMLKKKVGKVSFGTWPFISTEISEPQDRSIRKTYLITSLVTCLFYFPQAKKKYFFPPRCVM